MSGRWICEVTMLNLISPVDRDSNKSSHEKKTLFFTMTRTFKVRNAMMLIARCCFFFAALQFVVITRYSVSLHLAKKKQQRMLNTTQLRILGEKII